MMMIKYLLSILLLLSFSTWAKEPEAPKKLTLLQCFRLQHGFKYGHLSEFSKSNEKKINKTHELLRGLDYQGIIPWKPKDREVLRRTAIIKLGILGKKLPRYDRTQKIGKAEVNVKDIHWTQMMAENSTDKGPYTVINNAKSIKDGSLDIKMLPSIKVWRDTEGRIWTLDHRRMAAIRLSGVIEKVEVEFVEEAVVLKQAYKYSNRDDGRTIFIYLGDDKSPQSIVLSD